jgi:hypothetical protein
MRNLNMILLAIIIAFFATCGDKETKSEKDVSRAPCTDTNKSGDVADLADTSTPTDKKDVVDSPDGATPTK